jgi:hypothetical protein
MPGRGIGQEGKPGTKCWTRCRENIRIGKLALDLFPIKPIIGRNTHSQMNSLFVLSLIVTVIAVLIIKDPVSVRMATVRVKK